MSNISVDYDILNQKQTPAFYASSLATRPAFGFPGRIFIDTDTPSSGIYRDTGSAWVQVADPGAGTTGTLQQVTTNGNTTTLGIVVDGISINNGAGTGVSNIAIGFNNLAANTTGAYNTAVGNNSLQANTTASGNTALGNFSLNANTTGAGNTAIGNLSLQSNTTGSSNTAIGSSSLTANTTGDNNVGLGYQSLNVNTTGGANTGIGYNSLQANTTGGNNTALGSQTLKSNTTASFNTAIGNNSLQLNTIGTNNTAVGYASLPANTTGSNNTAIGYASGGAITTGSNNTIIGEYVGTTTLTSNIVLADGLGNVRLFSDANGLIGINQAVGSTIGGQLDIHSTQTYALVLNGLSTSNAYTAFSNASVGKWRIGNTYNAGANSFDIFNLGTSSNALSFNSTTNAATFGGTGEFSINDGSSTWAPIITMTNNSAGANDYAWGKTTINDLSLKNINNNYYPITFSNQGTYSNVGIATTSPNHLLSLSATSSNATVIGLYNTFNDAANRNWAIATNQTAFGDFDIRQSTAQNGNPITSGTSRLYIASTGNVLIGSTTDDTINKLQVTGSGIFSGNLNWGFTTGATMKTIGGTQLFASTYTNVNYLYSGGTGFRINNQADTLSLLILDNTGIITLPNLAGTGSRAVLADALGVLSAPVSDISVKENINTIGYGLNEILKMNPVWFNYNDEYKNYGEGRQNGNIAQEMETIIPEAVFTTPSTGKMGINYDQLHAVYIKAIQELKAEIDALKNN